MSKIGRRPIQVGDVHVEIAGSEIRYKGKSASGVHQLPDCLKAELADKMLKIMPVEKNADVNLDWGMHRAVLANKLKGAAQPFERQLRIVGLGYKAVVTGNKMQLSLGFSHKVDVAIPAGVTVETDKSGQLLTFKSTDRALLGHICSYVRDLKPPEPYKGTGIQYSDEVIKRKAGKAKAAA